LLVELKSVEDTSWLQLFIKNTALCKHESGRIRCDACPVFLINSRHPLVCATCLWLPKDRYPFFRSYGVNLPSSFNTILSSALVYSTSPPVSVSGTVYTLELFPGGPRLHQQSNKPVQR